MLRTPDNVMGRHVEGYWVREGYWFLRWHVTDDENELFNLQNDLRNEDDVSGEYPRVMEAMLKRAQAYQSEKGADPRVAYYQLLGN